MIRKKIFISLPHGVDRLNFEQILKVLVDYFKPERIEFIGFLNGFKIISVNGDNYKVCAFENIIRLKLTTDKSVRVPSFVSKIEAFERYNLYLKNIYKN